MFRFGVWSKIEVMDCSFGSVDLARLRLVAFDLDGTLAPSKSPIAPAMARVLESLLVRFQVAVMSGGQLSQFRTQLLAGLDLGENARNLHLLPTCGTQYYRVADNGILQEIYVHNLDKNLRNLAKQVLETAARELGFWEEKPWGEVIEDRGTQITFSALGQDAPLDAKEAWDPDGTKKRALVSLAQPQLPELAVHAGGSTSVDVTGKGIDKAYGMRALLAQTGLRVDQVLFVGDRLDSAGNDYPVVSTGVACQAVTGWEQTLSLIEGLLD